MTPSPHPRSLPCPGSRTRVEIRPGEGGDDAERFAAELAAAVERLARRLGHHADRTGGGAGRTVVVAVAGDPAPYRRIAGVHRVQRVPEGATRRHTSTATVAVLDGDGPPAAPEVDPADVEITTYRASGPGGQHRNKTDSAVRALHVPTGLVVCAEESRSQHRNRETALRRLADRLAGEALERTRADEDDERRRQIADAGRPAKSFTHRHTGAHAKVVCHETGESWRLADFAAGRI